MCAFEDPTKCHDCEETFEFDELHIVGNVYVCDYCYSERELTDRYEWERDPMDLAKELKLHG